MAGPSSTGRTPAQGWTPTTTVRWSTGSSRRGGTGPGCTGCLRGPDRVLRKHPHGCLPVGQRLPVRRRLPTRGGEREHQWGPVFDEQIARGVDWMRSLGVRAVNNSWSRTWPWAREREVTAETIRGIMPETLPAFERHVAAGGVAVWAAGNGQSFHPSEEAVLPHYFPHLELGWLAVVGVDGDGRISRASWRCGVAAEWCLAAPMVLVTTDRNGRWNVAGGTSIAAPYVTASLAALKSMFPNLSYQDVRARMLATADRSGRYGDAVAYGRGRLDLDAASRPVGGTNFALGGLDTSAVMSTAGARAALPEGAIESYLSGRFIVVLDGFQRAPFEVSLDEFAAPRGPYLTMDDLAFAPRRHRREGRARLHRRGGGGGRHPGARAVEGAHFHRHRPRPGGRAEPGGVDGNPCRSRRLADVGGGRGRRAGVLR